MMTTKVKNQVTERMSVSALLVKEASEGEKEDSKLS
jgi:hypothetical protein